MLGIHTIGYAFWSHPLTRASPVGVLNGSTYGRLAEESFDQSGPVQEMLFRDSKRKSASNGLPRRSLILWLSLFIESQMSSSSPLLLPNSWFGY
ncbi:hypothetical protein TNCV_1367801 [Trichonephila clavipes]|nr:hypothetical protein TNCV_1367801 [Trichonephila clavipes]